MKLRNLALAVTALAATSLAAQEGPRFGLQATLNLPQSDLKDAVDSKMGYGLGAHMTVDLQGGHMIRPRLDATWYPKYSAGNATFGGSSKFSNVSLGVDYLYFVEGKPQGVYFTGGLSAVRWKVEVEDTFLGVTTSDSSSTTKLGLALGVGYQFNKTVGGELRYLKGRAGESDFDSVQAGVTFRF